MCENLFTFTEREIHTHSQTSPTECVCVCVCVCEREREREREFVVFQTNLFIFEENMEFFYHQKHVKQIWHRKMLISYSKVYSRQLKNKSEKF